MPARRAGCLGTFERVTPDLPRTLRYDTGILVLLDQRRLPGERTEVRCMTASDVAEAIRDMAVRGAPAIGVSAAYGVVLDARAAAQRPDATVADVAAAVDAASERLAAARPTAVNLGAALARMRGVLAQPAAAGATAHEAAERLEQEVQRLEAFEVDASRAMGRLAADVLPDRARLLVHCNTGALATVERGTALAAVYELHERGRLDAVYVDETRPRLQGARLTAYELSCAGIPYRLVVDSLAATLMRGGDVNAVLVGADRIALNGDVANKVGTYGLAVACAHHGVPLVVVAPTTTIDVGCPDGDAIPIEERDARELTNAGAERIAPRDATVYNPAFDVTPAALVHALVTERGVVAPVDAAGVARVCGLL